MIAGCEPTNASRRHDALHADAGVEAEDTGNSTDIAYVLSDAGPAPSPDAATDTLAQPPDLIAGDVPYSGPDVAADPTDIAADPTDIAADPTDITADTTDITADTTDTTTDPVDTATGPADTQLGPADTVRPSRDVLLNDTTPRDATPRFSDAGQDAAGDGASSEDDSASGGEEDALSVGGDTATHTPDVGAPECAWYRDCERLYPSVPPCQMWRCDEGFCALVPLTDGRHCDDESLCTADDVCVAGVCVGTSITCDDHGPCTAVECAPEAGCVYEALDGPCEDSAGMAGECRYGVCCVPYCGERECGGDGCGGVCGVCTDDATCGDAYQCVQPVPSGPGAETRRLWRATLQDQVLGAHATGDWLAATVRGSWGLFVWAIADPLAEGSSAEEPTLLQRSYYSGTSAWATRLEVCAFSGDRVFYRTHSEHCVSVCPLYHYGHIDLSDPSTLDMRDERCLYGDVCQALIDIEHGTASGDTALFWTRGQRSYTPMWWREERHGFARAQTAVGAGSNINAVQGASSAYFLALADGRLMLLDDLEFPLDPVALRNGFMSFLEDPPLTMNLLAPAPIDALARSGDRLVALGAQLGVLVLDVGDPRAPRVVAENLSLRWPADFDDQWAPQISVVGASAYVLYLSDGDRYVDVLDIGSGGPPELLGTIAVPHQETPEGLHPFAAFGHYLAIPDGNGLLVLGPANP